jgi:VWFA-related protein
MIVAGAACAQQFPAQEDVPVFRTGVAYVRLDVQVVEGRRVAGDLAKRDFRVFDEDKAQELAYFGRETDPLWVALLMDISGSMRRKLGQMAAASRQALAVLRPGDHVAILLFAGTMGVHLDFTENFSHAAAALSSAQRVDDLGSSTAINAAIVEAAGWMRQRLEGKPGRRAIVVLTDNRSLNYKVADAAVIEALYSADAVLNAIVPEGARPPPPPPRGVELNPDFTPPDVFLLAAETGGEVLRSEKAGEAFREMMERVRTRYSLHYRAPEGTPGSFRRVRVQLSEEARRAHRRAEVRARAGYYVPR